MEFAKSVRGSAGGLPLLPNVHLDHSQASLRSFGMANGDQTVAQAHYQHFIQYCIQWSSISEQRPSHFVSVDIFDRD
ncbi:uncharacterized protein SCHCODRAFT_02048129 [Schizophyllum commune H4-8]|uniref:uncharacterized protein n=1 Tax=Schizophyllum commune (strain H4-8 / FGSC 9210) TaxID=578458 RepID=UPI00215E013A|nr:uncharacterized protein SCHCODRAFT_02048129 [Schizophyllum commune H4-8]KAI5888201.1 hypothetical protein SCHCODRAFT_02048129 [Schizophyllum commune H4-8]